MAPVVRGDIILNLSLADARTRLRDSLGDGRIEEWTDGRTRWRTHADTVPWLASRILHLGCEFEVCGPLELSRYLRELADRIMRAVSESLSLSWGNAGQRWVDAASDTCGPISSHHDGSDP
jgi:hypothetical protein